MTKKHFEAIAWVLKTVLLKSVEEKSEDGVLAAARTAKLLADQFQAINPNFKRGTFYKACGISEDGCFLQVVEK